MKIFLRILLLFLFLAANGITALAVENPLDYPNNKFGVHILFPEEIETANDLVNSNGGEWGYITIPIQYSDRDLVKWQKFMDDCYKYKLIPIVRVATENYYFDTQLWRKPKEEDIMDFANFLNSLHWPTKNRYVVIFNEVNRFDEWGGEVNPQEYSRLLEYAVTVFKSRSKDFFIITAGLDNAANGDPKYFMNQYSFLKEMNNSVPGIFNQVDGMSSHSYPNPAFSQSPAVDTDKSITSFKYERDFIKQMSSKDLPIFITETGWSLENVREDKVASYFQEAFGSVWNDQDIVAVTPFLLRAGDGSFAQFSLINKDNSQSLMYKAIKDMLKVKGKPILIEKKEREHLSVSKKKIPLKNFENKKNDVLGVKSSQIMSEINAVKTIFKWLINL